jgi:hypothetical protein
MSQTNPRASLVSDMIVTQLCAFMQGMYEKKDTTTFQGIPFEVIHACLNVVNKLGLDIISVGSKKGELEYIMQTMGIQKIVCIDSEPELITKFPHSGKYIRPHFETVERFLSSNKINNNNTENNPTTIVDNCGLLLPWPQIGKAFYQHVSPTYDYDAIFELKPKCIVIIYEKTGGTCSATMQNWLITQTDYKIVFEHNVETKLLSLQLYNRCMLLVRTDVVLESDLKQSLKSCIKK